MIQSVKIQDLGKVNRLDVPRFGLVNLVIGPNGTGKTFLLKSLYVAHRTMEDFRKGDDNRNAPEILADHIRWCFQTEKLSELVRKGCSSLHFSTQVSGNTLSYSFSNSAEKKIIQCDYNFPTKLPNSIFLPAKEVLGLFDIITETALIQRRFGFDRTYSDLVQALKIQPHRGKNYAAFKDARQNLEKILGGKAEYDPEKNKWSYKEGNNKFSIGIASEGVKKISILDRLLANGYVTPGSVVFIDELESALHPEAISKMVTIIGHLAQKAGIQFFISTHSYHVVKCLYVLARRMQQYAPCLSCDNMGNTTVHDLSKGVPPNPIVAESIRLYEEELDLNV